jgi:TatD DNase family protein
LPLVIHSREAEADTIAILEDEFRKGSFRPLLHCYTSKPILAERGLKLGAYVSFSGILTYKNAEEIRAVARTVPEDRLLVETDAPYLAPVPMRGKTNEPAFVVHTLARLAALRGRTTEDMGRITNRNFFALFSKAKPPEPFGGAL